MMLHDVSDEDFALMLARLAATSVDAAAFAGAGIESSETLTHLRALAARLERVWFRASWAILVEDQIVGLIGCKAPPNAAGEVEIGYGVAADRRRHGYATAAVANVVGLLTARDDVRAILAQTVPSNVASHRVLERNGFERIGSRIDPADGELIVWRRA
ncbi:MAG: GNAT family N-acetyltransferase, partial [Candidatus Eremiobacteraeota bacterium]|nr:GNAT family N-acetyltransferase [Candidatus Eremiobacteraeota bacterium]